MKRLSYPHAEAVALAVSLGLCSAAQAQDTPAPRSSVVRTGEKPTRSGPAENFTGQAVVTPLVDPKAPGHTTLGMVTFAPGARSNWHTHPAGQSLYITEGCGWVQEEGAPMRRVCKGDTIYAPTGTTHWHGATDTMAMTHLAITESPNGKGVVWGKPVTDAEYRAGRDAR